MLGLSSLNWGRLFKALSRVMGHQFFQPGFNVHYVHQVPVLVQPAPLPIALLPCSDANATDFQVPSHHRTGNVEQQSHAGLPRGGRGSRSHILVSKYHLNRFFRHAIQQVICLGGLKNRETVRDQACGSQLFQHAQGKFQRRDFVQRPVSSEARRLTWLLISLMRPR